jgi:hypothetical protein
MPSRPGRSVKSIWRHATASKLVNFRTRRRGSGCSARHRCLVAEFQTNQSGLAVRLLAEQIASADDLIAIVPCNRLLSATVIILNILYRFK